jgi:acetylornithine deacetylase/succinyl-diaminopimelate desuccinylase-like protein
LYAAGNRKPAEALVQRGAHTMRSEFSHLPAFLAAVDQLPNERDTIVQLACAVQQVAAPTFAEGPRAAWVLQRFAEMDLCDVMQDELANVYARLPARAPAGANPLALLISAHTDTVFPADTNLTITPDSARQRLAGPGLGDNSAGVAALLHLAALFKQVGAPVDIWFVANTGEEGVGDLRGMRAVLDRLGSGVGACIVLEGMGLGRIVHMALGSRRFRIAVNAPGGHSWSAFGAPSAVHLLVQLAERLTRLDVPSQPRTTFNIGRIGGGTSINTIAEAAWLELDLRSEQGAALERTVEQVVSTVRRFQSPVLRQRGVTVTMDLIGDRPTGEIAPYHPLVRAAERSLLAAGVAVEAGERMSSTDANIPLSRGIPAVCVGITRGANAHRLDEWISTLEIGRGMQHAALLSMWAAEWLARGKRE